MDIVVQWMNSIWFHEGGSMVRNNIPWEALASLLLIMACIAIPAAVGFGVVKVYRIFRPIQKDADRSIVLIGSEEKDSFIKMFFVGLLVCAAHGFILFSLYSDHIS
jgi:hypothetical protein